jgi:hypothetical protein
MSGAAPRPLPGFRLVGEDGNAYFIMGRFLKAAKKAKVPQGTIDKVFKQAKSGNYDNLLRTFIPWSADSK